MKKYKNKFDIDLFYSYKETIDKINYEKTNILCKLTILINIVVILISLLLNELKELKTMGIILFIISILMFLFHKKILKQNDSIIFFYIFILLYTITFSSFGIDYINIILPLICLFYSLFTFFIIDIPIRYSILIIFITLCLCIDIAQIKLWGSIYSCTYLLLFSLVNCFLSYCLFKSEFTHFKKENEITTQNTKDPLTGLYNRKVIEALINNKRNGTLFMIDIDNFKKINDKYGHSKGDKVLIEIADIMKHIFRTNDCVARIGGDEFAIFLKHSVDSKIAISKAEELLKNIKEKIKINGKKITSCSIGIAFAINEDYKTVFEKADQAMYQAKKDGKNRYKIYQ